MIRPEASFLKLDPFYFSAARNKMPSLHILKMDKNTVILYSGVEKMYENNFERSWFDLFFLNLDSIHSATRGGLGSQTGRGKNIQAALFIMAA